MVIRTSTSTRRLLSLLCSEKFTNLIFLISALFGISPLVFANGHLRVSYKLFVYSIFFYCTIFYFTISDLLSQPFRFPLDFHRNTFYVVKAIMFGQTIVFFCTSVFSCRRLSNIRHSLGSVRSSLRAIGIAQVTEPGCLKRALHLLLLLTHCLLFCFFNNQVRYQLAQLEIIIHILGCGQYIGLGQELYCNLHRTVRCLHWMKRHPNKTGQAEMLTLLSKAHHKLCSATEELSSCYGFQILYTALLQFLTYTISFFIALFYNYNTSFEYDISLLFYYSRLTLVILNVSIIDCSAKISEKVCI